MSIHPSTSNLFYDCCLNEINYNSELAQLKRELDIPPPLKDDEMIKLKLRKLFQVRKC